MTVKQLNILRVYHQATADELVCGLNWYRDANCEADRLSQEKGILIEQSAGIIAAMSPGLRWDRNVEAAERIIQSRSLDGLGIRWYDGVRKAKRILRGHSPCEVLKGNKVKAFYHCICHPQNETSVCCDGHAYSIWAGRRITLDDVPPMNNRLYHRIASDYVIVSRDLSVSPCQLQAITWCTHRRLHEVA
jgi:hypothetical protein